jgi:hypothetical protein
VQRHEYNHTARGVTWRGNANDRAIAVDVVALGKSEVRTPFESKFFVPYVGKRFAKLAASTFVDELASCGVTQTGTPRKSGRPLTWSQCARTE